MCNAILDEENVDSENPDEMEYGWVYDFVKARELKALNKYKFHDEKVDKNAKSTGQDSEKEVVRQCSAFIQSEEEYPKASKHHEKEVKSHADGKFSKLKNDVIQIIKQMKDLCLSQMKMLCWMDRWNESGNYTATGVRKRYVQIQSDQCHFCGIKGHQQIDCDHLKQSLDQIFCHINDEEKICWGASDAGGNSMKIGYDEWTMKNQIDRCYSQSQNFKINIISLYDDIDDDNTENELELEFISKDYYVQSTSVENENVDDENLELLAMKRNWEKMKKRAQAEERYLSVKTVRSGVYHCDDFK